MISAALIKALREAAEEIAGWGAGNEAGIVRLAADRIAALEAEASEGERLRAALRTIAHTFTEDSHGGMKTMSASYYQEIARRALIPEAPAREGWMPIETAPKDGTNVIVAEPDGNVTIARWLDRDENWWELNNDSTDVWGFALNAVQWRPLPPPPSQDREPDSQRGAK